MTKVAGIALLAVLAIGVVATSHNKGAGGTGSSDGAHITAVANKSSCIASGVSDAWTGDGKVQFLFMLRNTGASGNVSVTPVRHYSDGATNESAMDTMDVTVGGYSTEGFHSDQLTYKAHEHQVVSCGLRINNGPEVPIAAG